MYVYNASIGYEPTAISISSSENRALKVNCISISPVGRLKAHADSTYIVDVVVNGYKLSLKSYPTSIHLKNNNSARDNPSFVTDEIESVLGKTVIT